ncbi:MAG TPA: cytochrome c-type biogenesis protein [Saliniramus sp.]|nr:cytochrome c-type biogenesis protein [Saliniramus sp.]
MSLHLRLSRFLLLAVFAFSLAAPAAHALQPDELLDDPALEQRAREISAGLRCLVCQNQSIDDSDAPLALDVRVLVRERLEAGDSNADVESFVVARYGDFVLLRPPVNAYTIMLWVAPALVLFAGAAGIFITMRRRRVVRTVPALSEQEREALARILDRER